MDSSQLPGEKWDIPHFKFTDTAHYQPIPQPQADEYPEIAWGIPSTGTKHQLIVTNRPKVSLPGHCKLDILYCGICHTDCHFGFNFNGMTRYPSITGHEVAGRIVEVGPDVTKFKVGDLAAIGVIVDSCFDCENCKQGDEQYCPEVVKAYNMPKNKSFGTHIGGNTDVWTHGGYTGSQVINERFLVKIPEGFPLEYAGPIMCAGITLYDPLKWWGATAGGKTVGVVGIGGLGTMGLKLAKALNNRVVALSSSGKKQGMCQEKGADFYLNWSDKTCFDYAQNASCDIPPMDLILITISVPHQVADYLPYLKVNGTIVELGLVTEPHHINQMHLFKRKQIAASNVGGMPASQELMDLCFKHGIYPDIKVITANDINNCWEDLCSVDSPNPDGIRYVVDMRRSKQENKEEILKLIPDYPIPPEE